MTEKMNIRLGYTHNNSGSSTEVESICLSPNASTIVAMMADDPFVLQRDIGKALKLSLADHKAAMAEVRSNPSAQQLIRLSGTGSKYWTNTIAPLESTGTLKAAINKSWMYPNRVGLYTGLSCMFYCGFCGRNPVAKYESKFGQIGRDVFFQCIDQDPKTDAVWSDRFRISGGLEPLTNPFLGDIITYGKDRGYNMQLYTNGNMMTESYITKNPGMLDLEAVRFSLYGTTQKKAFDVTKNKQSFTNIINNIITYINHAKNTKVGLNWIILPGHTADVLELLDIVNSINEKAAKPIDFVTFREDFSQNIRVVGKEERAQLIEIFQQVSRVTDKWPTHFDFGYALEPLRQGMDLGPMPMIDWQDIIPEGFPQIAVALDCKGDLYNYHETCFIDRPGSTRYIMGNILNSSVEQVTKEFVEKKKKVKLLPSDIGFLDAFDHVISMLINQARDDANYGITWEEGPFSNRL